MICPMMTRPFVDNSVKWTPIHRVDCPEEECAWWDKQNKMCCIQSVADFLYLIANRSFRE